MTKHTDQQVCEREGPGDVFPSSSIGGSGNKVECEVLEDQNHHQKRCIQRLEESYGSLFKDPTHLRDFGRPEALSNNFPTDP
jgi:hypothetical protein